MTETDFQQIQKRGESGYLIGLASALALIPATLMSGFGGIPRVLAGTITCVILVVVLKWINKKIKTNVVFWTTSIVISLVVTGALTIATLRLKGEIERYQKKQELSEFIEKYIKYTASVREDINKAFATTDGGLRFNKAEHTKEKTITFYYTFTKMTANEVDAIHSTQFFQNYHTDSKLRFCKNMKKVAVQGLTFEYVYLGNDGKVVRVEKFDKKTCGL